MLETPENRSRHDESSQGAVRPSAPGKRVWTRLREFWAEQIELHERLLLIEQPWKEELALPRQVASRRLRLIAPAPSASTTYAAVTAAAPPGESR